MKGCQLQSALVLIRDDGSHQKTVLKREDILIYFPREGCLSISRPNKKGIYDRIIFHAGHSEKDGTCFIDNKLIVTKINGNYGLASSVVQLAAIVAGLDFSLIEESEEKILFKLT